MNSKIRICIIGAGFVGRKHIEAYKSQNDIELQVLCDTNEDVAKLLAQDYGFKRFEPDWHKAVISEDVDLICVCVPNNLHFEIVSECIKHGKNICCEKPLGVNSEESKKLALMAQEKEVKVSCCYNIIHIPAILYAKKVIASGELGEIVCFKGSYYNGRLADPNVPFEWRMLKENAKGGSLCDLAINILAVSQFLVGNMLSVCGMTDIIHKKRKDINGNTRKVENDDVAHFICVYENGAMGYISSNRVAPGSKQDMNFEIQLTRGVIKFSLERMNEIKIYKYGEKGFSTIIEDEKGWFCIGYEELKRIHASSVIRNIKNEEYLITDFNFAVQIDSIIESVLESNEKKTWVNIN